MLHKKRCVDDVKCHVLKRYTAVCPPERSRLLRQLNNIQKCPDSVIDDVIIFYFCCLCVRYEALRQPHCDKNDLFTRCICITHFCIIMHFTVLCKNASTINCKTVLFT